MKDTDKVELTVGSVKKAAESCGTAKEVLKTLFPEVFKETPEWEVVPLDDIKPEYVSREWEESNFIRINHTQGDGVIILYPNSTWVNNGCKIKIENGKLWRRKL